MWAWRYGSRVAVDDLERVTLPDRSPQAGEVLLRMRAAALNFRDLAIAAGHYHVGVKAPLVPLSDGAGEVVAVGAGVDRVQVGDLACPVYLPDWIDGPVTAAKVGRRLGGPTDGVLCEYMCLREGDVVRAPRHLDAAAAATLPVAYVTAWRTLFKLGALSPGQRLVVQGAGGVSTAAVQLAAAAGMEVVSVIRQGGHSAAMRNLGAADVVVVDRDEDWTPRVLAVAPGGVDAALTVAGGVTLRRAIATLGAGGRVLMVGYAGGVTAELDIFDAIRRGASIQVATAGSRADLEAVSRFLERSRLTPMVAHAYPEDDPREAMAALRAGGHLGKIVLEFA